MKKSKSKAAFSKAEVLGKPLLPVLVFVVLTAALPDRAAAQNTGGLSYQAAKAFSDAGIPVLKQPVNPIDFTLPLVGGSNQKLSDLRGKVVFLNFWATWCPPCRQEMPSMETLYRRFKDQGLELLSVNCAEKRNDVLSFMNQNKLNFPAALDTSGSVSGRYGVQALPTTYILNREGKIVLKVVGSLKWDDPKIAAAFETLLKM
ncbi:MAG: TlpA family protein disulfide reductase [Treponema sp.]|jgi:thiol-disulfide isomerase/thioredoxin|nr:TlpA family protein disulfide reductase [Treponema sp.]